MKKRSLIRKSLEAGFVIAVGLFTFQITWNHFRGGYLFWNSVELAVPAGVVMAIYTYWRLRRKPASENGDASEENVMLKEHPLLVPSLRMGLGVAGAVFTLLVVLSHFRGAFEFWRIFSGATMGGVAGTLEGYRRALRKLADEESEPT